MSIRRGWTVEEDKVLKLLKEERKIKKWSSIAKIMDFQFNMCGRNGKQCRQRYNNHLDKGIVENKLSFQEQKLLENLNDQIGNKWSVIAKAFNGRTANFLKNQIYSKLRKSIRKLNKFMKEMKIKQVKPFKLNIVYKIVQSNDFKIFEKQRHNSDDLRLYSQIKNQLFRYAQKSLSQEKHQTHEQKEDLIEESKYIISNLIQFQRKYETLHKKMKKPRKRYYCQDDIILNSLSNNKIIMTGSQLPLLHQDQVEQDSESQSSEESSSLTSDKKLQMNKPQKFANKLQIKQFQSKNFENYKSKDLLEEEKQSHHMIPQKVVQQKKIKRENSLELSANHNCKIVEEAQIQHHNKVNMHLEQSQQCHFIDIQYLDHFKSCSMIEESFFQ